MTAHLQDFRNCLQFHGGNIFENKGVDALSKRYKSSRAQFERQHRTKPANEA